MSETFKQTLQERIDFHDVNGSMAEAADMPESAAHHNAVRRELQALMDDLNAPPTEGEMDAAVVDEIVEYFTQLHRENPPISGYEVRSDILDMITKTRAAPPPPVSETGE